MNAAEFLTSLFEENTRKIVDIEYKEEFRGSTGYFEPMMSMALGLPMGTRFRFNTGPGNNRRVVGIVTPVGNVIFFDRFTGGENEVVVQNVPAPLSGLYPTGAVTFESIHQAMGGKDGYGVGISEVVSRICNIANMLPIHAKVGWLVNREIVIGDSVPEDFEGDHLNGVKDILAPAPETIEDEPRGEGSAESFTLLNYGSFPNLDHGGPARLPFSTELPVESRARMEMTQVHARAKIEDPDKVDLTAIMARVEAYLTGTPDNTLQERVEELAGMLPETGDRYRRARLALRITAVHMTPAQITNLMVHLRTADPAYVNGLVNNTIANARLRK